MKREMITPLQGSLDFEFVNKKFPISFSLFFFFHWWTKN